MVVNIFDPHRIEIMSKKRLLRWFFDNFPYKAENFSGIPFDKFPEDEDFAALFADLASLSLLMLDKNEENEEIRKIKSRFQDLIPFKECNEATFAELDKYDFSTMFFPIETGADPEWGICVRSSNGGTFFFDSIGCVWKCEWSGTGDDDSYQLAKSLAGRLLDSEKREHLYEAAKNWIVTGKVDKKEKVGKVGLENKLQLPTKRKFILPEANHDELPEADRIGKAIKFADTVEAAWNHITNQGTKNIPEASFPPETDELHVLVGGNIKAQVASIIFSNPKKVFLWYSESVKDSQKPAEYIEYAVKRYMKEFNKPVIEKIEKNLLSSKSMAEAEKTLKEHFDGVRQNRSVIFNVTSGNRIMSYAVQTIARAYRNIELVYRDIDEPEDAEKYFFTRLIYNEFPPYSGKIWGKANERISMEFLCGKEKYENGQNFYDQLIKKEG